MSLSRPRAAMSSSLLHWRLGHADFWNFFWETLWRRENVAANTVTDKSTNTRVRMWTQRNKETIRLASYGWAVFLGVFKLLRDRSARFARKRFYPVSCLGESSLILLSASCFSSFRSNILLFAPTETRSCRKLPEAHSIKVIQVNVHRPTRMKRPTVRMEIAKKWPANITNA